SSVPRLRDAAHRTGRLSEGDESGCDLVSQAVPENGLASSRGDSPSRTGRNQFRRVPGPASPGPDLSPDRGPEPLSSRTPQERGGRSHDLPVSDWSQVRFPDPSANESGQSTQATE